MGFTLAGLGAAAATLLNSIGGPMVTGLWDARNTDKTNQANKDIAADTNATNYAIAQENLKYQRENQEYTRALNQQLMEREDTAYQRTVNDMRAAGLSPLSMQNTNGAGSVVSSEALNNAFEAQTGAPMQAAKAGDFSRIGDTLVAALDAYAANKLERDKLISQDKMNNAQAELISNQAESVDIENRYKEANLLADLRAKGVNSDLSEQKINESKSNALYTDEQRKYISEQRKTAEFYNKYADDIFADEKMRGSAERSIAESQSKIAGWSARDAARQETYDSMFNNTQYMSPAERALNMLAYDSRRQKLFNGDGSHRDYLQSLDFAKRLHDLMNQQRIFDNVIQVGGLAVDAVGAVTGVGNMLKSPSKSERVENRHKRY